jgi:hypothetical protein
LYGVALTQQSAEFVEKTGAISYENKFLVERRFYA